MLDKAFIKRIVTADLVVESDPPHLLAFAHDNKSYTPDGSPYAELRFLPNDITPYSLSDSNETDGIFRVILRWPANTGAVKAKEMADRILSLYPIGSKVGGATIVRHNRQEGDPEPGWYKLIITIGYRAFLPR